jgi:hypothetical protein
MVYLPTLGDLVRANVGKYSSTMERMGISLLFLSQTISG